MSLRVSVVVPTYRRTDLLDRCLTALAAQTLPGSALEIVVVHDGPSERTRRFVDEWQERMRTSDGAALHYGEPPRHGGPAAARNVGWRLASAPIIAFTDDDTVPDPRWLERALAAFANDVDAAWGRITMPLPREPTDYELDAAGLTRAEFVTANCFCRKRILDELGGFDERFAVAWREDADLFFRLLRAGAAVIHIPDALVVHPVRPAPWGVSIAQQRKVLFDALLFKKHPAMYRQRIRPAPRWDYYAAVASLAASGAALFAGATAVALGAAGIWCALTGRFCIARLRHASKNARHVAEMVVTSAAIPPLAVFWRLAGAWKFRVLFI